MTEPNCVSNLWKGVKNGQAKILLAEMAVPVAVHVILYLKYTESGI